MAVRFAKRLLAHSLAVVLLGGVLVLMPATPSSEAEAAGEVIFHHYLAAEVDCAAPPIAQRTAITTISNRDYGDGEIVRVSTRVGSYPAPFTGWERDSEDHVQIWGGGVRFIDIDWPNGPTAGTGGSALIQSILSNGRSGHHNGVTHQDPHREDPPLPVYFQPGDEVWTQFIPSVAAVTPLPTVTVQAGNVPAAGVDLGLHNFTCAVGESSAFPTCEIVSQSGPGGSIILFEGAVDGADGGYLEEWTFSDGTTSNVSSVNKTATEPGTFTGTYRIYRTDGSLDRSVTCEADVAAPAPQLRVTLRHDDLANDSGLFALDEEFDIVVRASASNGVGDLSAFLELGALLERAGNLEVLTAPDPAPETQLTLRPGEGTDEMVWRVRAATPGDFTAAASLTNITDAAGSALDDVEVERNGRVGALTVSVVADPNPVELEEGDDAPEPEFVDITVTVTNPLPVAVDDLVITTLDPHLTTTLTPPPGYVALTYEYVDPGPPPTNVRGTPPPITVGRLGPGESVDREITAVALNAGDVEVSFLVRAQAPDGTVGATSSTVIRIGAEFDFVFDAFLDDSTTGQGPNGASGDWVDGGSPWAIEGSFSNRTVDTDLVMTVVPKLSGNAAHGVPIPEDSIAPDAECTVGLHRLVEPDSKIEFAAPVRTRPDGAADSIVEYMPEVFVVNDDGSLSALDPERQLVTPGSNRIEVSVDVRDPVAEPVGGGQLAWIYGASTIAAIVETASSMGSLAVEALGRGVQFWSWPAAYRQAGVKISEYLMTVHDNLSPADRELWLSNWAAAAVISTGMTLADARALVDRLALESFTELHTAWATGDTRTVAEWWGKQTGENIDAVVGGALKTYGVCKLISSRTPWGQRALAAKQAAVARELADLGDAVNVKNFPTGGIISREHRRALWGIDDAMYRRVQNFVDEFGIAIGVRRRGPGAIDKIENGTHVPKVQHNKAKNTAQPDVEYMGFVNDLDTAAIKEPPLLDEFLGNLPANLTRDQRADLLARHEVRMEEWHGKGVDVRTGLGGDFTTSERFRWAEFATPLNGIPVPRRGGPIDYAENVRSFRSVPPDDAAFRRVPARIRTLTGTDDRPMMVLEVNLGDGFKPMTGDMDALVVTKGDFTTLSEAQRVKFYKKAYDLGFEHPDSASWNDPAGRNGYLRDHSIHAEGSEAIYTWMPNQAARATRFDPRMSWAGPNEAYAAMIYLRGARIALNSAEPVIGDFDASIPADRHYAGPRTVFFVDPNCTNRGTNRGQLTAAATLESQCTVDFDRGPDAVVIRQLANGDLESWTSEGGWVPFAGSVSGHVAVLPQTVTTTDTPAGARRIEVLSREELDAATAWFEVGDVVVVDPGGPNEETATIDGFGSLIFAEPLRSAHAAGTMVTLRVAPVVVAPPPPTTTPESTPTTTPATIPMDELPRTGSSTPGRTVPLALALLLAGVFLLTVRRRRSA